MGDSPHALIAVENRLSQNIYNISHTERTMLVERFQNGDIGAFDELFGRYHRQIYRLAYHFTHNCEDAYDISQEVFMKVFRSLGSLRNGSAFDTWLRRITVNTCIDYLRQRPNEETIDDSSLLDHGQTTSRHGDLPNVPVEAGELRNMISRAVDQLPKRQKKVFILRHYEGLSLEQVARTLKCPLGTVKANLFHATRRLRKLLSHYIL